MPHPDPTLLSLLQQRELIASGAMTSVELTTRAIERIRALDPALNIVIRTHFDAALERSRALDAQPVKAGALYGVPFTLKDAFRVKGLPTSYGFPGLELVPALDHCKVVERLLAAGAVLIGQTNVPFSCFDWQTNNPVYGLTRNPLDPERTVGGSSGGSAASVAAHFSSFEVGSDVAGSIRYPAHACRVFGLRPTHDFVPYDDIGPSFAEKSFESLAVAGPLARSLADLRLILSVLTGSSDNSEPRARPLRVGYTTQWSGITPNQSSRDQMTRFLSRAAGLGHEVVEHVPAIDFDRCTAVWGGLVGYEYKLLMPPPFRWRPFLDVFHFFFNTRRFRSGAFKESFERGLFSTRDQYEQAKRQALELRAQAARSLEAFDVWVTPVSSGEAIVHQRTGEALMLNGQSTRYAEYVGNFLTPTTVLNHPILVAPIGTVGLQFHGKAGRDWQLLADCAALDSLFSNA